MGLSTSPTDPLCSPDILNTSMVLPSPSANILTSLFLNTVWTWIANNMDINTTCQRAQRPNCSCSKPDTSIRKSKRPYFKVPNFSKCFKGPNPALNYSLLSITGLRECCSGTPELERHHKRSSDLVNRKELCFRGYEAEYLIGILLLFSQSYRNHK